MKRPEVYEYDDGTLDVVVESRTEDDKRRRATHANVTPEEASRLVSESVPKRRRLAGTKPPSEPIDWPAHLTNIPADRWHE